MSTSRKSTGDRWQFAVLFVIVLLVGLMAGAASFSHVHDWTMHNSPAGTGDWFGWANAVITELIPTAALIVIAIRRRNGEGIGYPMFLLVVAVGLSLTAQLAVAQPTVFGWMVSALPALAFFALSKLVFSQARPIRQATAPHEPLLSVPAAAPTTPVVTVPPAPTPAPTTPAALPPAPTTPHVPTTPAPIPAPAPTPTPAVLAHRSTGRPATPAPSAAPPAGTRPARTRPNTPTPTAGRPAPSTTDRHVTASDAAQLTLPVAPPELLARAAQVATEYRAQHGTPITAGQLAVRLKVTSEVAAQALAALNPENSTSTIPTVNGQPVKANR